MKGSKGTTHITKFGLESEDHMPHCTCLDGSNGIYHANIFLQFSESTLSGIGISFLMNIFVAPTLQLTVNPLATIFEMDV